MPSVGLRRSTRVFGLHKGGVDGGAARVLRSGRCLWPDPSFEHNNNKLKKEAASGGGEDWLEFKKTNNNSSSTTNKKNHNLNGTSTSRSSVKSRENGWAHHHHSHAATKLTKFNKSLASRRNYAKAASKKVRSENLSENKKFGVVYTRKRKREDVLAQENLGLLPRQRRDCQAVFVAVVDGSCGCGTQFGLFLSLVLSYLKRVSLRLSELAAFLFTEPVAGAFASSGIRFLQDSGNYRTGICKFFKSRQFMPIFLVDFSAVPLCFVDMHLSLVLRFGIRSLVPVNNSLDEDTVGEGSDGEEDCICSPMNIENNDSITAIHKVESSGSKMVLNPSVRFSKLACRSSQFRNGLNSRGIQKRRSSLRRRKARNPSHFGMHKANGVLVTESVRNRKNGIRSRKNGIPFFSAASKSKLRSSVLAGSAANLKEDTSDVVGVAHDMDLSSCNANILVTESDRCYRIEGATITLELSDSGEWILVMKKDGFTRFTHSAQKHMRPCTFNRITHGVIWTGDANWKLEFPNRHDWLIFKGLYKECSDRKKVASSSKAIPVPGVHEVLGYRDIDTITFTRPDAYISLKDDEVVRALAKRTANYDMDSEDDEWLKTFNSEVCLGTQCHEHLSEDNFELMIDAFEKAYYCSPDDFADDKAAMNLFVALGGMEVVEAVYGYWMKRRKQKRSALLRVFLGNQPKKAPLITKPILRKRRSFKRQCSQFGRGKQPAVLQAEQDALEEQTAMLKVEEAKMSANKSAKLAIAKRRRAQLLMENADLATYKAAVALRIAEAASVANPSDAAVVSDFLD